MFMNLNNNQRPHLRISTILECEHGYLNLFSLVESCEHMPHRSMWELVVMVMQLMKSQGFGVI